MPERLHLVRHGEVRNPDHICYADLAGFPLSSLGSRQAAATGEHLATAAPGAPVITSPLERSVQTAEIIATCLGVSARADDRLTEWGLSSRWAGVVWEDLPDLFPGELEAYLEHPHRLPFSPESLAEVADRMTAAVADLQARYPDGAAVLISHQDPIQALRLALGGRPLHELTDHKPRHCEVISFEREAGSWREAGRWLPSTD